MSLAAEGTGPGRGAVEAGSAADQTLPARYRRLAWLTLGIAFVVFCLLCVGGAYAALRYSEHATQVNTALVEIAHGTKLEVRRAGQKNWTLVADQTTLNEDDSVRTGQDTEAWITMFDGSTVQLYYSSTVTLRVMRASQFLNQFKDIELTQAGGSIKASAAPLYVYTSMKFHVFSDDGQILVAIPANSTALITTPDPAQGNLRMLVATQAGEKVTVRTNGVPYDIALGNMRQVFPDGIVFAEEKAQAQLIDNGDVVQQADATQRATLLAPGWRLSQPRSVLETQHISADVVSETLEGHIRYAARFVRDTANNDLATVSIRQEMDTPVNFYGSLILGASVKVVDPQAPAGNLYPLTIQVTYDDQDGRQQIWKRQFYAQRKPGTFDPAAAVLSLFPGDWAEFAPADSPGPHWDLMTQSPAPARIKAVEVIVTGYTFNASVTDLSLVAR